MKSSKPHMRVVITQTFVATYNNASTRALHTTETNGKAAAAASLVRTHSPQQIVGKISTLLLQLATWTLKSNGHSL